MDADFCISSAYVMSGTKAELPYGLIKDLWQIHSRDSHMEFTGKNKVGNTT